MSLKKSVVLILCFSLFLSIVNGESTTTVAYHGIRPTDPKGYVGLRNPDRGFRMETRFGEGPDTTKMLFGVSANVKKLLPANPVFSDDRWRLLVHEYEPFGVTLIQSYCYLTEYKDKPLSKEKLRLIQQGFDRMRSLGIKALPVFAYEKMMGPHYKGAGMGATEKRILQHIAQLKPILRKNSDVIFAAYAGFIGAWGEGHSATHFANGGDWEKKATICKAFLDALGLDKTVLIRSPQQRKYILNTKVFEGVVNKYASRLGIANAGFFAGKTEGGTWTEPPFYANPGNPEFDEMTEFSPKVIVGGELFWSNLIQLEHAGQIQAHMADDGLAVAQRMKLHHYSFFSLAHSYSGREGKNYAIDNWMCEKLTKAQTLAAKLPISDGYFENQLGKEVVRTPFEYIRDHLGYRWELRKTTFTNKVKKGDEMKLSVSLINRGFSTIHSMRDVFVTMTDLNQKVHAFKVHVDPRLWQPFDPKDVKRTSLVHEFKSGFKLPESMGAGWYELGLWFPDPHDSIRMNPSYAVRLANRDVQWWTDDKGEYGINLIGLVEVVK